MLSLGPGSACDVCLEPFDQGSHAPHSIRCGHVFCLGCLHHLSPVICPLCRQPFEPRSFVKLHIDLDSVRPTLYPNFDSTNTTSAEQEARRLQEAIAGVANQGASEHHLRQLIDECRAFLVAQPRPSFQDLRVSHRMLAYMCEVRSKLRAEKQIVENLDQRVSELGQEKKELEQRIENLLAASRDEKETALAVEMSLREHCDRAQAAYDAMADRYKLVLSAWERLNDELSRLRSGSLPSEPDLQQRPIDVRFTSPDFTSNFPSSVGLEASLNPDLKAKGVIAQDPGSFLISPLPEFTGRLPSSLESFSALPEVDDDLEKRIKESLPSSNQTSPCGAHGCPFTCHCVPFPLFPNMTQPNSYDPQSNHHNFSTPEPIVFSQSSHQTQPMPMPIPDPRTPSGLSLTMPKTHDLLGQRASRSHSFSSRPSSRSRSRPSSRAPSRPSSPLSRPMSTRGQDTYSTETSPTRREIPGHGTEQLRTRLHDLLQDSPMSSSLPNLSSAHFPLVNNNDMYVHRSDHPSRPPSRSASTASHRPLPSRPSNQPIQSSATLPGQPARINVNPPAPSTSTTHNSATATTQRSTTMSHASSAALALEKAQRAEKERQRAERERQREERHREKERDRSERDRPRVDIERSRPQQAPATTGSISSQSSSLQRDGTSLYSGSGSSSSSSSSRRDATTNGHVRLPPSSLHNSTNAYVTQQRYPTPVAGNTKGKISTVMASTTSVAGLYA